MNQSVEKPSSQEKPAFETALEQLQASVKKLESGELTLEQSLKQFEEGVRLTRICQEYLAAAEQKVEILMKSAGEQVDLQNFGSNRSSQPS